MRIQIDEIYAVSGDVHGWQICLKESRIRNGQESFEWRPVAWYASLAGAAAGLVERHLRTCDVETLRDALDANAQFVSRLYAALQPQFEVSPHSPASKRNERGAMSPSEGLKNAVAGPGGGVRYRKRRLD